MRMLHLILPRRIPSRSGFVNIISSLSRCRTRWTDEHILTHEMWTQRKAEGDGDRTGNRVRIQPAYRSVTCR